MLQLEETQKLSEVDILYNTNLFKLQADELFKENQVKLRGIEETINDFKKQILSIPEIPPIPLEKLVEKFKSGSVLLPTPPFKFNGKKVFKCGKIENVSITGSFEDGTYIGGPIDILFDFPLQISKTQIQNKHYFLERALFLCHIAQNLTTTYEPFFTTEHSCCWLPQLKIRIGRIEIILRSKIKLDINLDVFLPSHRNAKLIPGFSEESDFIETPYLNQSMLMDTYNHGIETELSESIRNTLILVKTWAKNRPFCTGKNSVSGFMLKSILLYLKHKKLIFDHMSYYQILRVFFHFLASDSLMKSKPTFCISSDDSERFTMFRSYFAMVLLDSTSRFNYLFDLSKNFYDFMKYESEVALRMMNVQNNRSLMTFTNLFLTPMQFDDYFDCLLSIESWRHDWYKNMDLKLHHRTIFDIQYDSKDASRICIRRLIKKALKDRLMLCCYKSPCIVWRVDVLAHQDETDIFGLILSHPESLNLMIKGPLANLPEALEFRSLYGDFSRVFKFSDGFVHEMVCLQKMTQNFVQSPTEQIARCVLKLHCGLSDSDIKFIHSQMDCHLLYSSVKQLIDVLPHAEQELNHISSILGGRNLKFFKIKSISGTDPIFSKTAIFSEDSRIHVRITAEIYMKTQLFENNENGLELNKLLIFGLINKYLSDKNVYSEIKPERLEIKCQNLVLDLHIYVPYHLQILYDLSTKSKSLTSVKSTSFHIASQARYHAEHVTFIKSFVNTYPAFSDTVKLFKTWVYSHLMWSYFPDELSELLVAYIFHNPFPKTKPNHHYMGLKSVLRLLGNFDWQNGYLVLDTNKIDDSIFKELEIKIKTDRNSLSSMIILTPYDNTGTIWSNDKYNCVIHNRIVLLAKAAYEYLKVGYLDPTTSTLIFSPNISDFEIVIETSIFDDQVMNFFKQITTHFDGIINLFMNPLKPKYICGVFVDGTGPVNFNVKNSHRRSPLKISDGKCVKGKCIIDLERVKSDIKLIGKQMCGSIVLHNISS
ncbi:Nucleolar protein 6 [Thelohanellus kitauei]|uniref:Nucleolar protein 6 n=1 Tax=Thelohanellus kitauei TaxID=669202 RepID=A0A0C2N5H6_THEKT|nr:Nucleolar protein 6 [Thelohanellus kitauei]